MFGVTILGNNSAIPAYDRHPAAQVVTLRDVLLLIDCGEGTQIQMSKYKIRRSRISYIFISHLHGDHYFGLPGLITSMGLLGREEELHLFAPPPLKEILDMQLKVAKTVLPFSLIFHPLQQEGFLVNNENFSAECFTVYHRIDCWGFIINEKKKPRKLLVDKANEYNIPVSFYEKLKDGEDYISPEGNIIKNELVTAPNTPARRYAYCSDTVYTEHLAEKVKKVNLLYHETTYLQDQEQRAARHFHSTTIQAAKIAELAEAKKLLIGHFSSKYEKLDSFITEAQEIFPDTQLALEGATYLVS